MARKIDLDLGSKTVGCDLRRPKIRLPVPMLAKTALIDGDQGEPVLLTGRNGDLGEFDTPAPYALVLHTSGVRLAYQLQMRGFTVRITRI